jgi:hypothetical protein
VCTGCDTWVNENDVGMCCVTLGGSKVWVGDDPVFGDGVATGAGST